jgi:hypothetical protein
MEYAIANLKMSSSPRPDKIYYRMISHLPGRGRTIILELFNQMHQERTYSTEWSQYEIFFIKKADDVTLRPISLASCFVSCQKDWTSIDFCGAWSTIKSSRALISASTKANHAPIT